RYSYDVSTDSSHTRRSSDLTDRNMLFDDDICTITTIGNRLQRFRSANHEIGCLVHTGGRGPHPADQAVVAHPDADAVAPVEQPRSEEHTSELQSRENLVCRL